MTMLKSMAIFILFKLIGGDIVALATLWANQIIAGHVTYADVPKRLKDKVASVLKSAGCEDLATE